MYWSARLLVHVILLRLTSLVVQPDLMAVQQALYSFLVQLNEAARGSCTRSSSSLPCLVHCPVVNRTAVHERIVNPSMYTDFHHQLQYAILSLWRPCRLSVLILLSLHTREGVGLSGRSVFLVVTYGGFEPAG